MSTQEPTSRIAPEPTPVIGPGAAVVCPICGAQPASDLETAEERAAWCRRLGHGDARARSD